MKTLYSTLFAVFITVCGFSQSVQKAYGFLNQRAYSDASEEYRLINDKDQEVLQNLADSYGYTNRMQNAGETYRLLSLRHEANVAPEYKFRFAHALRFFFKQKAAYEFST